MKSSFTIIFLLLGLSYLAPGQDQISAQYAVAWPTSDLKNYIGTPSFRGFSFELHRKFPRLALGGGFGWHSFYERKTDAVYRDGRASFSGTQDRYSNLIPLHLSGYYLLSPEKRVSAFAGLGAGAIYGMRVTDMGLYRWADDYWSFSLVPEAGIIYWQWLATGFKVSVRYNQGFRAPGLGEGQSFMSISAGLIY